MKKHYITKNGVKETGEMSVFEAVDVWGKYKQESGEKDVFEIHSICVDWGLKKEGDKKFSSLLCGFESEDKALSYAFSHIWNFDVFEVREFVIWYRSKDGKDFKLFYTDTLNLSDAVDEAIEYLNGVVFAIVYDGETVAKHGVNLINNPDKR